jgi:hypothetical protein
VTKFAMLSVLLLVGCGIPESRNASGMVASDEPRIWVVKTTTTKEQQIDEVYRCADGAEGNQPPKPVCVRASMVDPQ